MRALIMAGGSGSRLGRGEKPLMLVNDQPMIRYVVDAFAAAGCEPVVVVSPKTSMTANWCRARGIAVVQTSGEGYIEDMIHAVCHLEESGPVIISVSDIPCISPEIVTRITNAYDECGKDALSTWVPATLAGSCCGAMPYREMIDGIEACPAGINILRGDQIGRAQQEYALLLDEPRIALNVNTPAELSRAKIFLQSGTRAILP